MAKKTKINAAKISLEIVELLREIDGATLSEVAERMEMPKSTVYDYLQTLHEEEYLIKNGDTYNISTRFLQLGQQARANQEPFQIAKPEIEALAEETGEHANLMIEEHDYGVFLYKTRGPDAVSLDTHAGMRVPLQTTSLGKSIMAYRPRDEVEGILDRRGMPQATESTITDREEQFEEFEEIRARGYAFEDEERVKVMRCVAAPIKDENERAIAAVSVSGPKSRMREQRLTEEIPELVLSTANVIEVNLTYS
jgi:DNA-binding IclR family transcriptional regulator